MDKGGQRRTFAQSRLLYHHTCFVRGNLTALSFERSYQGFSGRLFPDPKGLGCGVARAASSEITRMQINPGRQCYGLQRCQDVIIVENNAYSLSSSWYAVVNSLPFNNLCFT